MFDFLLLILLKSLSWFLLEYLRQQRALTETLTTHLIVSCPDGKPTEEAPKGRGRGFGGMNSMKLVLIYTNGLALDNV